MPDNYNILALLDNKQGIERTPGFEWQTTLSDLRFQRKLKMKSEKHGGYTVALA